MWCDNLKQNAWFSKTLVLKKRPKKEEKKRWYLLPDGEWLQVSVPWRSEFLLEGPKLSQHARVTGWNVDSPHPSKANSLKRLEWAKIREPVRTCGLVLLVRPPATHVFSVIFLILTTLTVLRVIFVWRKETIYQCLGDYRQMGTNSKELEVAHPVLTFAVNLNDVRGTSDEGLSMFKETELA